MKLVTISWIRNEADVIEAFVRHNGACADRMIIILHRSEDSTQEILEALQKEGMPLDIRTDQRIAHEQGEALTDLLPDLAVSDPDAWILPLDADEFLGSTQESVHDALRNLSNVPHLLTWKTYVPTSEDRKEEANILRRITHRRKEEVIPYSKLLFPASLGTSVILPLGSHQLVDCVSHQPLPMKSADQLFLAHFPIRSENQLRTKIIGGWLSHSANTKRNPGEIYQWQELFERAQDPKPITAEELQEIALRYALFAGAPSPEILKDPLPTKVMMKYPVRMLDPWLLLPAGKV